MEPFVGEIRMFSFSYAPQGWALCDGSILQVQQNQALYVLLVNQYRGGDGRNTFALPDLRGRVPMAMGFDGTVNNIQGTYGGAESVALTATNLPAHTHATNIVNGDGNNIAAANNLYANSAPFKASSGAAYPAMNLYSPTVTPGNAKTLNSATVAVAGAGQAHDNMQPFLVMNYCIAIQGLFPPRN